MQFALAGGLVMLAAMVLAGMVISGIIARSTVDSAASRSALFLESQLSPLVQPLAGSDRLAPEDVARLDEVLKSSPFSDRFAHVDIWRPDGSLPYSTTGEVIGGRFTLPEGAATAFTGQIAARYTDLSASEHTIRGWQTRFLEVYVPLHERQSGRTIAVVEVHEVTEFLERELFARRAQTWLVVVGATLVIALALFGIVWHSGTLIAAQKTALQARLEQIERISALNRKLRNRVQRASARLAEMNETLLRSVGAELHDGPEQLVGLATLKLDQVRRAKDAAAQEAALRSVESILREAQENMRNLASGLMLPEINGLSLAETVRAATEAHAKRSETPVRVHCDECPGQTSAALRLCVFRFIQEGLNNAFRHADARDQAVECRISGNRLHLRVSDSGKGERPRQHRSCGLGLIGLRERVESLGGTFLMSRRPEGTAIEMIIQLEDGKTR